MSDAEISVLVAKDGRGGTILRAPKIGFWSAHPRGGTPVEPGSSVGTLTQLGRRFVLLVPPGVSGRVAIEAPPLRAMPVEYGAILLRVVPPKQGAVDAPRGTAAAALAPKGTLEVGSPTDGVFYRSPAPEAKPYVIVGDRVIHGQPVGLIEVMKTFNPIAYGGAGLPEEAEVVEILAVDGQEVRAGQALLVVRRL